MQLLRFFWSIPWGYLLNSFGLARGSSDGIAGYRLSVSDRLAAKELVFIDEAALEFVTRFDTGATISSINARDIEVVVGSGTRQRSDKGKRVRFAAGNAAGRNVRVEGTIDQGRGIATLEFCELRYHVYLTVVYGGASCRLLMNLNDRRDSKDKLLFGRNWLRRGFVVDASRT